MNRMKTLSLPLLSLLVGFSVVPARAQVSFEVSSLKTYRQNKAGVQFRGGTFNVHAQDGSVAYIGQCSFPQYYPPGVFINICAPGTTGFVTAGRLGNATIANPYLLVTAIQPAIIIAPRRPEEVILKAAPASTLPRPSGGFAEDSISIYYNLHDSVSSQEFTITNYDIQRTYSKSQRGKFDADIVPGVYHYELPRIGSLIQPAVISAVIYPMVEGKFTKNNKESGFEYAAINGGLKWNKAGYAQMSYLKPNIFTWKGIEPNNVFAAVDVSYFSLRVPIDDNDPNSGLDLTDNFLGTQQSYFPAFAASGDPKVLLANVFVSKFTTPPIFLGGMRAIAELQLSRSFATGGVTYDFSNRKFQLPVEVVNSYDDYKSIALALRKKDGNILQDADGDGYNNLNEWILDSNAGESGSIPAQPRAEAHATEFDEPGFNVIRAPYFGFTIEKKLGTVPNVIYTLQRSTDNGKTWTKFKSDANWSVQTVRLARGVLARRENVPERVQIRVESNSGDQPAGTENDRYRVKITLRKKN